MHAGTNTSIFISYQLRSIIRINKSIILFMIRKIGEGNGDFCLLSLILSQSEMLQRSGWYRVPPFTFIKRVFAQAAPLNWMLHKLIINKPFQWQPSLKPRFTRFLLSELIYIDTIWSITTLSLLQPHSWSTL